MKKIIISLIIVLLSITSVNAAKECKKWDDLFSKQLFFYYPFVSDLDYKLNSKITKKLDNIVKFDQYTIEKKKKILNIVYNKLFSLWQEYLTKLGKKYGDVYTAKNLTIKEKRKVNLFIGLNNYFAIKYHLMHKGENSEKTIYLKSGKILKLSTTKYKNYPEDSCATVYEGVQLIYENSDFNGKKLIKYNILENNDKIYLFYLYYKGYKYDSYYVEVYEIGKNLLSFKQPLKTLKIDEKESYEVSMKKLLKVVNMSYEKFEEKEKLKIKDIKRISDLNILQTSIEQYYMDEGEYPSEDEFEEKIKIYVTKIPKDDKEGQIINGCKFGYKYEVFEDENGIENQNYILSTCLKVRQNVEIKAKKDGGIYDNKYEKYYFKGTKEEILKRIKKKN